MFEQVLHVRAHPQFFGFELRVPMGTCPGQYSKWLTLIPHISYIIMQKKEACMHDIQGHLDYVIQVDTVLGNSVLNSFIQNALSPLMLASKQGHAEIVELLIENQTNLETRNKVHRVLF